MLSAFHLFHHCRTGDDEDGATGGAFGRYCHSLTFKCKKIGRVAGDDGGEDDDDDDDDERRRS